jgi:hypothetical protein
MHGLRRLYQERHHYDDGHHELDHQHYSCRHDIPNGVEAQCRFAWRESVTLAIITA